tara:strand:+ start:567 stop:1139 length:573 start_codon:yes stop_codon:yes gene_type:complete
MGLNKKRFLKMARDAEKSENLVCNFLENTHHFGFYMTSKKEQKNGISKKWHVPDIKSSKRIRTTIEVKEDFRSSKTGNVAIESDCLERLKNWSLAHQKTNMFLAYINHQDFQLDVLECGHLVDKLKKELEWLCVSRIDCKELMGGDTNLKLWIIPIYVLRSMLCNVTKALFTDDDMKVFREIAEAKLSKE